MKNTTKMKRMALICAILAALLVIAGCSFASPANDAPASQDIDFSGEVQVGDEEALRKALKDKGDCTVVLTQDIVITEELTVNGNKKLSGGSIIMDMRRVGSGESVLAIQKGATVVLDGATIDGNGVANCVSVKSGGCFESVSGSLIYGYPYGLDVSGTVSITDIHIDEAMHTAINVAIFGEVDMLGGSITNNVYGIAVAEEGRMNIADGVTMENSYASFIVNYGDMDIVGGKYDGAHDNAIENWGTLSIKGTEDKPIEICNGTKSALNSKNSSTLTAEHIKIYDMGWHGMCVEKNSTASLKDIYVENAGKSTLYVNSSKAKMEDVTVIGGAAYAVYATQNADVEMYNITIKNPNNRGINNERSSIMIDGMTMEGTAKHGIYATGIGTVTRVNDAVISGPGVSAIAVVNGEAFITNTYIENTTKEGISVGVSGKANIENVTIMNNGNFGIANYGGKTTAKNVRIYNTENVSVKLTEGGTFTGDELIIMNSYSQAISVEGGSVATVTNTKINGTKKAAVYVDKSKLNMSYTTIKNSASYGVAAKNSEKVSLDHIEVYNAGEHGVGNINSYMLAGNIKVYDPKRCGIYTEGADSQTNMAWIEVYNAGTSAFGFKGGKEITARNVTIENPKNEGIYALAAANVKKLDNVVIKNPGSHGISVEGNAIVNVTVDTSYNPENTTGNGVTILNPGKYGLRAVGGTLTAVGATVTDAREYGVNAGKDGIITVKNCVIENPGKYGINISAGGTVTVTDTTVTNAGDRGVSSAGKLILTPAAEGQTALTIDKTTNYGIYTQDSAVIEGSGLTIKNAGTKGIFVNSTGTKVNVSKLLLENAGAQGVETKGDVTLTNFAVKGTGSAAVKATASAKVTLTDGLISSNTYGIAVDGTTETTVTNVSIERTGSKKDALVNIAGNAKLELAGTSKIDGKNSSAVGVNVAAATATFTMNGASITGTGTDVVLAKKDACINLKSALTETLTVKPATYDGGIVIAVNAGISEDDFKASTKLIDVGSESSYVGEDGKLATVAASVNGVSYGSLQAAIDAAADGDTVKILAENATITKTVTKGVKLTADTAVTVTVDSALNDYAFKVAAGKTLTVEGAGSGKITVESSNTGKDVFYNEGTLNLTNVNISGGKNAINTRADSVLTVTNVGIDKPAEHGINIAGGATATVSNVSITNTGKRGISSGGALTIHSVSIETAGDHGVYLTKAATITGAGLGVKNTVKRGIFSDGASWSLSDVTVEDATLQGVYLNSGKVTLSNFTVKNGKDAGIYLNNGAQVTLNGGSFSGNTGADIYFANKAAKVLVQTALTSKVSVEPKTYDKDRVMAEKAGSISDADFEASMKLLQPVDTTWVVDETGCLAYADHTHNYTGEVTKDPTCTEDGVKTFTCSICNDSYTESIPTPGHSVTHVAAKIPTLEAEGNIEYWYCTVCNTYWKDVERTQVITQVETVIAQVAAGNVAYMNGTAYATLEAAVAAANETTAADTITLLCDVTLAAQIKSTSDITITADKAVTITANMKNTMVNVAGGTLKITGASESAKITLAAGATTTNIVHNSSNVILTNVHLAGNTGSTVGANAAYGIYNNAGSVTATSVTITDIVKGDGINIRSGASARLDNVTISNTGRYGLKTYGTVDIYNTTKASNALSISSTYDHAVDIDKGGKVISHLSGVSTGTYVIKIDTTSKSSSIGILVRAGGSIELSGVSVCNVKQQGVYFFGSSASNNASGSLSNFMVTGTGAAPVELKYSTATLTDGIVDSEVVKDANSTLTSTNVTVQ